jgi:hypothetical protein
MYTSVLLFALAGYALPFHTPVAPTWLNDYDRACKIGRQDGRPLAVFLAPGKTGPQKLITEGKLDKDVEKLLGAHYVCVFLDTSKEANQRLAARFELNQGKGIVISDRSGSKQAFRKEGLLPSRDLERSLRRYADAERVVLQTETVENQAYRAVPVVVEPTLATTISYAPVICGT